MDSEAAAPLQRQTTLLLRRSTRVGNREPQTGAAAGCVAICCSLLCALTLLVMLNALSVACIVIGVIYLDKENCPGEPNLAPVLIATGVLAIVLSIFEGRSRVMVAKDGSTEAEPAKKDCCYYFLSLLSLAKFVLFIYFCVIVFSLNKHVHTEPYEVGPDEPNYYCNANLFLFSFWLIIFMFVVAVVAIFFVCCCLCCGVAIAALVGSSS